jgi:uncharacterized membrane protein YgcG
MLKRIWQWLTGRQVPPVTSVWSEAERHSPLMQQWDRPLTKASARKQPVRAPRPSRQTVHDGLGTVPYYTWEQTPPIEPVAEIAEIVATYSSSPAPSCSSYGSSSESSSYSSSDSCGSSDSGGGDGGGGGD